MGLAVLQRKKFVYRGMKENLLRTKAGCGGVVVAADALMEFSGDFEALGQACLEQLWLLLSCALQDPGRPCRHLAA